MTDWDCILNVRDQAKGHLSKASQQHIVLSLRRLKEFCHARDVKCWQEFDTATGIAFIAWLRKRRLGDRSIRNVASRIFDLLVCFQQLEPAIMNADFVYPSAHLPPVQTGYPGDVLTQEQLESIFAACVADIAAMKTITRRNLIPFLVLLCLRTGMNPSSITGLGRDCLQPHPDSGSCLVCSKKRSRRELRQLHHPEPWGVLDLVAKLQALTQGDCLLSFCSSHGKKWMPLGMYCVLFQEWRIRHGLPPFRICDLRPAAATFVYRESDGNVLQVQRFLHHKSPETTNRYLSAAVITPMNDAILAEAQEAMYLRLMGGDA